MFIYIKFIPLHSNMEKIKPLHINTPSEVLSYSFVGLIIGILFMGLCLFLNKPLTYYQYQLPLVYHGNTIYQSILLPQVSIYLLPILTTLGFFRISYLHQIFVSRSKNYLPDIIRGILIGLIIGITTTTLLGVFLGIIIGIFWVNISGFIYITTIGTMNAFCILLFNTNFGAGEILISTMMLCCFLIITNVSWGVTIS